MTDTIVDYKSAGVDIDAGNALVQRIKPIAAATSRPEVLKSIGGFGAMFQLPIHKYKNPVLVSATDGVGTKLMLAQQLARPDTVGIDLVAMCVNDLITIGAEPLFFLDYYATGHLSVDTAERVIRGIAKGCQQAGAALVGGETAEMPGMYSSEDYDLAGFCVGIVEKDKIIDAQAVQPGDVLLGVASSGPHSNGYSLIRKILQLKQIGFDHNVGGRALGDLLLEPTQIYVKPVLALLEDCEVHAIAHITGGGLIENIPRVLPDHCKALVDTESWQWPEVFRWLQVQGNVATEEMYRTFNCGVGLVICLPEADVDTAIELLGQHQAHAWRLGSVVAGETPIELI